MVYKSPSGPDRDFLCSKFVDRNSASTYSLRGFEGKLSVPLPRTEFRNRNFNYAGAVLWDSLPLELRQAQTLQSFRAGCGRYFN